MLENCHSLQEKWGGVSEIIDRWLEQRRLMLVKYCDLSTVTSFDGKNQEHGKKLQHFCQLLVDYVSAGHFEVYHQLAEEGRAFRDREGLKLGAQMLEAIQTSTDLVLDFNDKYLETDDLQSLATDLSELGETLARRFELEDNMIEVLHTTHINQL